MKLKIYALSTLAALAFAAAVFLAYTAATMPEIPPQVVTVTKEVVERVGGNGGLRMSLGFLAFGSGLAGVIFGVMAFFSEEPHRYS